MESRDRGDAHPLTSPARSREGASIPTSAGSRSGRDRRSQSGVGLGLALLCAANGAFVPAVARLTSASSDPLAVATITTAFAAAVALVALAVRGELAAVFGRSRRARLVILGALGTALPFFLLFAGAKRVSAIETALCLQSEPLYSMVLAWAVLGHRQTRRRVVSLFAVLFGVGLAIVDRDLGVSTGAVLILLAPLAWQVSHLFVLRRLAELSPFALTGARYVYGGAILAAALLVAVAAGANATVDALPALAVQGVVLSYLGTLVWYGAIARLDLARTTAIVVPAIPVLSLGASFVLLGEQPTLRQAVGMALTVGGVLAFATMPDVRVEEEPMPAGAA